MKNDVPYNLNFPNDLAKVLRWIPRIKAILLGKPEMKQFLSFIKHDLSIVCKVELTKKQVAALLEGDKQVVDLLCRSAGQATIAQICKLCDELAGWESTSDIMKNPKFHKKIISLADKAAREVSKKKKKASKILK